MVKEYQLCYLRVEKSHLKTELSYRQKRGFLMNVVKKNVVIDVIIKKTKKNN